VGGGWCPFVGPIYYMLTDIQTFSEVAERYCAWVESRPKTAENEADQARSLLLSLYSAALLLPLHTSCENTEHSEPVPDDIWKKVYKRFSALPFTYYSIQGDPLFLPAKHVEVGDLADDLSDIYRDIMRGLYLFRKGLEEQAAWEWNFGFKTHWGHHCISALFALHSKIESR
jgi:hypothetical protein